MNVRTYWVGSRFVAEWTLTDPDGDPIVGATVTGTVSLPGGGTAAMTTTSAGNVYTAYFDATQAGTNAYRLVASVAGVDAHEDTFVVRRSLLGMPPITVDPTTAIGRVRLLATDVSEDFALFDDAEIVAFLAIEGDNLKRAAALALETTATSETLVSKKITTSDGLTTDGPAVAKALLDRAKRLRDQADEEIGDPDDFGLEIAEFDPWAAYRTF